MPKKVSTRRTWTADHCADLEGIGSKENGRSENRQDVEANRGRPCGARNVATVLAEQYLPEKLFSLDFCRQRSYVEGASRVGLTPSPTCQTWARWFPQGDAATSATKQVARMSALLGKPVEGFCMSKRKSGSRAAELPSPPETACVLVVDNTFDEFEVEICCQRTDGVDRAFSTSKDLNWLRAERPGESTLAYSVETLLFSIIWSCLYYVGEPVGVRGGLLSKKHVEAISHSGGSLTSSRLRIVD